MKFKFMEEIPEEVLNSEGFTRAWTYETHEVIEDVVTLLNCRGVQVAVSHSILDEVK